MTDAGVDCLLLSVGADLPYLAGYEALDLERLTMLVLPQTGTATLVVPRLEAPRIEPRSDVFEIVPWGETDDPLAVVVKRAMGSATVAIGDRTRASVLLGLQERMPDVTWVQAAGVLAPLRAVKTSDEVGALARAGAAVDVVALAMRDRPFGGRTEIDVQHELVERMLDAGHDRADFAIVASGPNGASPHHEAGDRVIAGGDLIVCDFGGSLGGYSSDTTRMFSVGEPSAEIADTYAVLAEAQEMAVRAAAPGVPAQDVDRAARQVIHGAGWGDNFVHRTGHGIGLETHEGPWIVEGNDAPLVVGNVFSVEPGIYVDGEWGMRLEDIVAVTDDGPLRLNISPRDIATVA